jgi:hypothetical protein
MSDTPASKAKRPAPAAKEPIAAAVPTAEPAALPANTAGPVVSLPAPARRRMQNAADAMFTNYRSAMTAVGESQRAVASGIKDLALEVTDLASTNLTAAGESAAALIGARNVAAAFEIQLDFARRSLETMLTGSARLSEIGVRLANEAARPIVAPLAETARTD